MQIQFILMDLTTKIGLKHVSINTTNWPLNMELFAFWFNFNFFILHILKNYLFLMQIFFELHSFYIQHEN